jgi:small subunit ribosomal protein S7
MRGKNKIKKPLTLDPKYGNDVLGKFINYVMLGGKKTIAQKIVYGALDQAAADLKKDQVKIFEEVLTAVQPQVEVRSRRVGGANYQVPMPVRGGRQNSLAFRWIINAARKTKGKDMSTSLKEIFKQTLEGTGDALKKRDEVHRMAEANKAFAHFARFSKR